MIVGRGEVKAFLFNKEKYTVETAKKCLKECECIYEKTVKQNIVESMKKYKPRLKSVRPILKFPDEVDDLKMSSDEKNYMFEFDPTVGDDNLVIYENYTDVGDYKILVNILDLLN